MDILEAVTSNMSFEILNWVLSFRGILSNVLTRHHCKQHSTSANTFYGYISTSICLVLFVSLA